MTSPDSVIGWQNMFEDPEQFYFHPQNISIEDDPTEEDATENSPTNDDPTETDPTPSDEAPRIVVVTSIHHPSNTISAVYRVVPGSGARITEVSYAVNGGAERVVYAVGVINDTDADFMHLAPGINQIVFTVRDSIGRSGTYTVRLNLARTMFFQLDRG